MRFLRPSSATRIIMTDAAANPDSQRAEDAPAPAPEASLAAEDDAVDVEPPPADTADAFPTSRRRFSMVIRAPAPSEATEEDAAPTDSPLLRTVRCCMGADAPAPEEVPAEEEAQVLRKYSRRANAPSAWNSSTARVAKRPSRGRRIASTASAFNAGRAASTARCAVHFAGRRRRRRHAPRGRLIAKSSSR